MSYKTIQIIAFNNPYPANFGGAIDMFYKIKALYQLGIKVHLHVFYNDRVDFSVLENLCEKIYRYKQNRSLIKHLSLLPFSTKSRQSKQLTTRLESVGAPILIESLRACAVLINSDFNQNIAVRCHNIEHNYSFGLAKSEKNILHKVAQYVEGFKQKQFENILNKADILFSISEYEQRYFSDNFSPKSVLLPVFQGFDNIISKDGFGKYALYHGDLSTADNLKSALFLIEVFKNTDLPFIIAGSKSEVISCKISDYKNISFVHVTDRLQMQNLIENAHINTLYSFQQSGTKLKVFNALYNGRHCIINTNMVDNSGILNCCEIAETEVEYRKKIVSLFQQEFKITEDRKAALYNYDDIKNAQLIIDVLY